jgi:hypothetical protein
MLNQILNRTDQEKLLSGICPDCGAAMILYGPRGGIARNVLCGVCRTEFNASPVQSTRMAKPCDPTRQKEVYGVDDNNVPVASFGLKRPLTRKELDEALLAGCQCHGPECAGKPLTEIHLKSRCHSAAGVSVFYKYGVLFIICKKCDRPIVKVAVAP